MFCPTGVYLATLGVLKPEQVNELTALGVEMVKAQGTSQSDATKISHSKK